LSILEELKEFMEPDKLAFLILVNTRGAKRVYVTG